MRVMNEREFWKLFKYDHEPAWIAKRKSKSGPAFKEPYALDKDAKKWLDIQMGEFDLAATSLLERRKMCRVITEEGERLGLLKWSDALGKRQYHATNRLIQNWDELYPGSDPDNVFFIEKDSPPSSVVLLNGWMQSLIVTVHLNAAIEQDDLPGRLRLNHKFAIVPQLEEAGWISVSRGPAGSTGMFFTEKALDAISASEAVNSDAMLTKIASTGTFAYKRSVLDGGGAKLKIKDGAVLRVLKGFGLLASSCEQGYLRHKESRFNLGTFKITKLGEKEGFGKAGTDYPHVPPS